MLDLQKAEALRRALFVPCASKDHLHRWIRTYLGLDMPNAILDPSSNSSPMDLLWEVYSAALTGNHDWSQMLSYASRDSFKTLGAAVLEVLSVVHLQRNVAHMAAIESQAKKAQQYIKGFFNKPFLREFVSKQNEREIEIARFYDPVTGDSYSEAEVPGLTPERRARVELIGNYIKIIICTVAGANSEHVPLMVVDEVDVVANPDAYEEAKMIPSGVGGKSPITLLTSTRKYSFGLVQKEIDKADSDPETPENERLQIRHWNIIDVTERCPESRHEPKKPRIPIYRSDDTLRAISEKEYNRLDPEQRSRYVQDEGYHGCLANCRLFAVCQGRLTKQPSSSKLLKSIKDVTNWFRSVSPEKAKAQGMCWKPSNEGLIYPNFDRAVHMLSYAQMASKITGDEYLEGSVGWDELINLCRHHGMRFVAGMDFGFTHNFAVVLGAIDGARLFILDTIAIPELELSQKIDLCEFKLKPYDPIVWADPAYPSDIRTFRRHGFKMRDWSKDRGSVVGGIEVVRMKMRPSLGDEPQLYMLKNDGNALLAKRLTQYHWKLDAAGKATDQPDEADDDECDALRYLVMNEFSPRRGRHIVPTGDTDNARPTEGYTPENFVQKYIDEVIGPQFQYGESHGKKGRFRWIVG